MIVNPHSGRRERIFVNLEAIYPTPEVPGTELSFEELWAANQGWLDVAWDDESMAGAEDEQAPTDENNPDVDLLSRKVAEKLVVHQDALMLDENGAVKDQARAHKPRKKKVMEVNETQISKLHDFLYAPSLSLTQPSFHFENCTLNPYQSKPNSIHRQNPRSRRRSTLPSPQ